MTRMLAPAILDGLDLDLDGSAGSVTSRVLERCTDGGGAPARPESRRSATGLRISRPLGGQRENVDRLLASDASLMGFELEARRSSHQLIEIRSLSIPANPPWRIHPGLDRHRIRSGRTES
jgi:hypothetical protein